MNASNRRLKEQTEWWGLTLGERWVWKLGLGLCWAEVRVRVLALKLNGNLLSFQIMNPYGPFFIISYAISNSNFQIGILISKFRWGYFQRLIPVHVVTNIIWLSWGWAQETPCSPINGRSHRWSRLFEKASRPLTAHHRRVGLQTLPLPLSPPKWPSHLWERELVYMDGLLVEIFPAI